MGISGPFRSSSFVGVAIAVLCLGGIGAAAQKPSVPRLELGRFNLGSFNGRIALDRSSDTLNVVLGVEHSVENQQIPADQFQTWLLLADGKSLNPVSRSPASGQKPMVFRGGGVQSLISFSFAPGSPVAVVLNAGSQFQVFPISPDGLRFSN